MKKLLVLISIILVFSACKKEEDSLLKPNAGTDRLAAPFDLVELDGTATTGTVGYSIAWTYDGDVPQEEINLQNTGTLKPTFIPPQPGSYFFTLTISDGGQSASDIVKVEVTGGVEIGGKLKGNLILKNIESDPNIPDYMITSDLIIPAGLKCTVEENGVVIMVAQNAGIIIEQGGLFSNYHAEYKKGYETVFKSTGWKGILVQGGTLTLQDARIEKAGNTAFTNYPENGAVILTQGSILEQDFSNNVFTGSLGSDFIMENGVAADSAFTDNNLSNDIPMKIPFSYLRKMRDDNLFSSGYKFIQLIPKENEIETWEGNDYFHMTGQKYYIDGIVHLGKKLIVASGSELYFKEGTGIVILENGSISVWNGNNGPVIMDGLDGAHWTGIALTGDALLEIKSSIINNAGHGVFNTPLYKSELPAAIYFDRGRNFKITDNSYVTNSGGYGIYVTKKETGSATPVFLEKTTYENTQLAAIRASVRILPQILSENHGNTFNMNTGIPAVLIDSEATFYEMTGRWPSLGNDNFYLADMDLKHRDTGALTIKPGAIFKLTKDKQLIFEGQDIGSNSIEAQGTADNPIIFDSANPNEKWGGIKITGLYLMRYCEIRNAGSNLLPDVDFPTAVYINVKGQSYFYPYSFQNCTIAGSDGYGSIAHTFNLKPTGDPGNADNNNVFSDNALDDILYID